MQEIGTAHIKFGAVLIYADTRQEAKDFALEYVETKYDRSRYSSPTIICYQVDDSVITKAFSDMILRNIKHE